MKRKAILFDVRSIQRYIFASDTLKTNIGASYIVETLFSEKLKELLEEMPGTKDLDSWDKSPEIDNSNYDCQIAYIGGGNAMVLFEPSIDDVELKKLVALFSQKVMEEAPGLHIGAAIGSIDISEEKYREERDELFAILKKNQNNVIPSVSLPYTGFTLVCELDGEVASHCNKGHYDSFENAAKEKVVHIANENLKAKFKNYVPDEYDYPLQLEDLGQEKDENNYIAVVHIDGNNMGVKFDSCRTMKDHRCLSKIIKKKTENSFARLLKSIVAEYKYYKDNAVLKLSNKNGKSILPIRPLILGGDDVTFVCPAKMAVAYAKRFIDFMTEIFEDDDTKEAVSIDCCGGIAILPTKYPFFRGYVLAEQLCDSAKSKMREIWDGTNLGSGSSWLDFIILHGEQAPTLKQILDKEYKGKKGTMHFGPYCVKRNKTGEVVIDEDHMLDKLIKCANEFASPKDYGENVTVISQSKIKEFRAVLQKDDSFINTFMQQLDRLNQVLPNVSYNNLPDKKCWGKIDGVDFTPYVDAIEMMDYMEGADKKWRL